MLVKIVMLIAFFGSMIGIGLYCRKNATDVNGFVLGGRSVGPWLTAFAYGTSYFSAVVFVGYAGHLGRYRKCIDWFLDGMGYSGTPYSYYDSASGQRHYAGILRKALWIQRVKISRIRHYFYLFDPLYCQSL